MDKAINTVLTRKKLVVALFTVLTAVCVLLIFAVRVNFRMVDYLPDDAPSTHALDVMSAEFSGDVPNARIMAPNVTVREALELKQKLGLIDGVDGVVWLDDAIDLMVPLEMADSDIVEAYYKDGAALYSVTIAAGQEVRVTNEVYTLLGEGGAVAGDASATAQMQRMSQSETLKAVVLLVPVIILLLLLTTTSWLEPVLFLAAIGLSVLLNMGTNIIFGSVSFITNSISPILQLAVSLDYAIFLLTSFAEYREQVGDIHKAMLMAVKRSAMVIMASAMTTFFGFVVLAFMRFKIGPDLGWALGKSILFSLISVLVFLPALTLCCHKLLNKTRHRPFLPGFKRAGGFLMKLRVPMLIAALILIVPAFLAQRSNTFSYGSGGLDPSTRAGQDELIISERFGQSTPMVLLVPKGDVAKEAELARRLADIPDVVNVISYANMVGAQIPSDFLDLDTVSQFYSEHYARIILYAATPSEGESAFAVVEHVRAAAAEYYGDEALSCGMAANLYDMRDTVETDNRLVSILAIVAIGLIIMISFRSLSLPIILVLTIQTAIWINLAVPYFEGSIINYLGFLVINTVQLGATVDYAILYSDHYMKNRVTMQKRDAAKAALSETIGSILTSGAILSLTGFMIGIVSTNSIVSELGVLLGRGTLLSMAMVLFILPALLTMLDKVIEKTTLGTHFAKKERSE